MSPETRISFSFRFGSHGQRFLLAVGFGYQLPTTTANCAVIVATNTGISRAKPLASKFSDSASRSERPQTAQGLRS